MYCWFRICWLNFKFIFSKKNLQVYGYDSNQSVIEDLSNCKTNVVEKNIQNYLNSAVKKKKFILCNEIPDNCETYIVAVGTPLKYDKKVKKFISNLDGIKDISFKLSKRIKKKPLIIFRSTLPIAHVEILLMKFLKK